MDPGASKLWCQSCEVLQGFWRWFGGFRDRDVVGFVVLRSLLGAGIVAGVSVSPEKRGTGMFGD